MGLWILDKQSLYPAHHCTASASSSSSHIGRCGSTSQLPLAEDVPSIEMAYRFTNIPLSDNSQSIGEKVRGVAYNKDACVSVCAHL